MTQEIKIEKKASEVIQPETGRGSSGNYCQERPLRC